VLWHEPTVHTPDGAGFWNAFRRGLLEPVPAPEDQPVPALAALPEVAQGAANPYAVDFTKAKAAPGTRPGDPGDLAPWKALLARQGIPGWGYCVAGDGTRKLAFVWPEGLDGEFLDLCLATAGRRAGRATVARVGDVREIRVGPGLPALGLLRVGQLLWAAPSARDLQNLPAAQAEPGLVRWARVDLGAVRNEAARWAKVEGPARPEAVRPLSDQVLGLLGWIPAVTSLSVERTRTADGWQERVLFGSGRP